MTRGLGSRVARASRSPAALGGTSLALDEHRHALDHPEARAIKTASIRSEEVRIDFFATVGAGSNLGEDGLVTAWAVDPESNWYQAKEHRLH